MGALLGAASCGRCGTPFSGSPGWCHHCGIRLLPAAPGSSLGTYSGLLAGAQLATPTRRRLATTIDAVPIVVLAGCLVIALFDGTESAGALRPAIAVVMLAVLYCVVQTALLSRYGRSLGRWLLALRTVDDLTGEPRRMLPADIRSFARSGRNTVTVDLRRGRDPLRRALPSRPRTLPDITSEPVPATRRLPAETPQPSRSVVLVLDTGERVELESSLLIGRAPVNRDGDEHPLFAWPDLERTLTKTHALLEWSGTVLWVTDLHSTNGSSLRAPDGTNQPLVPGLRGPAAPGYTITFGERSLQVQHSGVLESVGDHGR